MKIGYWHRVYEFAVLNLALEWKSSWMGIIIQCCAVRIKPPAKTLSCPCQDLPLFCFFVLDFNSLFLPKERTTTNPDIRALL